MVLITSKLIFSFYWQINFYINQREITRLECENKNRPEMKCNGKCYLAKQLKKADEQLNSKKSKSEHSAALMKSLEGSTFLSPQLVVFHLPQILSSAKLNTEIITGQSTAHLLAVFHPPC
jgi:hypothetical protein